MKTRARETQSSERLIAAVNSVVCAEALRPIVQCWGAKATLAAYDKAIEAVARACVGKPAEVDVAFEAIQHTPESHFDDSHYREFIVMLVLGVPYYGLRLVGAGDGKTSTALLLAGLDNVVFQVVDGHQLAEDLAALRSKVSGIIGASGGPVDIEGFRSLARSLAGSTHTMMVERAAEHGWSAD